MPEPLRYSLLPYSHERQPDWRWQLIAHFAGKMVGYPTSLHDSWLPRIARLQRRLRARGSTIRCPLRLPPTPLAAAYEIARQDGAQAAGLRAWLLSGLAHDQIARRAGMPPAKVIDAFAAAFFDLHGHSLAADYIESIVLALAQDASAGVEKKGRLGLDLLWAEAGHFAGPDAVFRLVTGHALANYDRGIDVYLDRDMLYSHAGRNVVWKRASLSGPTTAATLREIYAPSMVYDGGRPVRTVQPSSQRVNMVYDPKGRKILPKEPPADEPTVNE